MKDTRNQLEDIFRKVLKNEKLILKDNSSHSNIEAWDSLAHVNLIAEIEQQLGVEFTLKDFGRMNTFGEILLLIVEKLKH